jgi:hypothetical protein
MVLKVKFTISKGKSCLSKFKGRIVIDVLSIKNTLSEVVASYGLNANMVRKWKTEYMRISLEDSLIWLTKSRQQI